MLGEIRLNSYLKGKFGMPMACNNAVNLSTDKFFDRWNWRNVVEDETMHLCRISGELIHPIHYANVGIAPGELLP